MFTAGSSKSLSLSSFVVGVGGDSRSLVPFVMLDNPTFHQSQCILQVAQVLSSGGTVSDLKTSDACKTRMQPLNDNKDCTEVS